MNQLPHILFQLGEALGVGGLVVVLLFLCGGTVWVVMSVRLNKKDHERLEAKIDKGLERLEGMVNKGRESVEGKIEDLRKESRDEMQAWRKETREDSKETRDQLRSINSRLDGIIGQKPPDRSTKS